MLNRAATPSAFRLIMMPLALAAGLAFVAGCGGKSSGSKTEVKGKAMLGDKPINGIVVFVASDGKETSSPVSPEGTYAIIDPPTGPSKIYIKALPGMTTMAGTKNMPKGSEEAPPPMQGEVSTSGGVAPPAKYTNANSSGLSFDVKAGSQTYDLPLSK